MMTRALSEDAPVAVINVDLDGRVQSWNPAAERLFGWRREEVIGGTLPHVPSDQRARFHENLQRVLAGETITGLELPRCRKDGSLVDVNISAAPLRDAEGRVRGAVGVFADIPRRRHAEGEATCRGGMVLDVRDVTEHRRTEQALRDTEARYQTLFERNPFPMWVYDEETLRFLAVNDAAVEHYGYTQEEFLGMTIEDIRPPGEIPQTLNDVSPASAAPEERRPWNAALRRHRKRDETIFDVELRSTALSFGGRQARLVLAKDVSAERRLESQLRQAQKMDAVGRLAGGVAHDFNNILGVITGYVEIVLRTMPAEDPRARKLKEVLKAAERATGLTRQLLTFSRQDLEQPQILNLNTVVAGMEKMLGPLIGENIALAAIPEPDLWSVKANPGQIEQVLMNLAINARDAMPQGGRLVVETHNVEIDESIARMFLALKPGPHVMVSVSDTGEGMDAEVQSHIFEPFFTTKEREKGTGLGLSIVYGIVRQSGGHIQVYSHPGRGTTFKIYLPRDDQKPAPDAREETSPPRRGSETILLVEDDDVLRSLAREVLEEHGYIVLEAADGSEAVPAAAGHQVDLLLTDIVLRTTTGVALAEELMRARSDLKVLYMSGYTARALGSQQELPRGTSFLQKPFTVHALLRRVREILDSSPSQASGRDPDERAKAMGRPPTT
jgi:two-component system cell cycle sensor histidine kinase/response regulator CckA